MHTLGSALGVDKGYKLKKKMADCDGNKILEKICEMHVINE